MTSYSARFRAGEHERVWAELRGLGPVPTPLDDDVAEVAHETMRRVAGHIARIVDALPALGFVPEGTTPVHTPPTASERADLPPLAASIGGLPAALEACLAQVGWLSLLGDCPALGLRYHDGDPPAGMPPGPGYPDPLCLPSADFLREEWAEIGEPFAFAVAPDELHKADISGGTHTVDLPDRCADPLLDGVAGRPTITLVEYLRESVRWGGFPGWSFADPGDVPAALVALRAAPNF